MKDRFLGKASSVVRAHLTRLSHSIKAKHRTVRDVIPKKVRDHFDRNFVIAMLITVALLAQTIFISPSLAATYTATWTSESDFTTNGGSANWTPATTTSLTRADTTTTSGTLAMGPGASQAFTETFNTITTALDSSSSAVNGTLTGSPSIVPGHEGNAYSFNGTTQNVDLGSPAALDLRNPFTVSFWFKTTLSNTSQTIMEFGSSANQCSDASLGTYFNAGEGVYKISFLTSDCGTLYSTTAITANTWYHIVATWDGATKKLYISNGSPVSAAEAAQGNNNSGRRAFIANRNGYTSTFTGTIDDIRVYSRGISSGEVSTLYNTGTGDESVSLSSGLIGFWKFNENSMDTVTSTAITSGGSLQNGIPLFNATSTADNGGFGGTTVTGTHVTGSGSDRVLLVAVTEQDSNNVSAVTYNGQNLTRITGLTSNGVRDELWYLINPPIGSYTVLATLGANVRGTMVAETFYNVNQSTPFGTVGTSGVALASASVSVSSAANELVADFMTHDSSSAPTPGASQTVRANLIPVGFNQRYVASTKAGASSVTMSWTIPGANTTRIIAVPIKSPNSVAISNTIATVSSGIAYAQLAATSTLNGGTVTYELSNDNGTTWKTFTPGSSGTYGTQSNFNVTGTQLKYKVTLTGGATVDEISIAYNGYSTTVLGNVKKDAGGDAIMTTLAWNVTMPANTAVSFRTRGATEAQGPNALYTASWSDYTVSSSGAGSATIKTNGNGSTNPTYRYLEIEATLTSNNGIAVSSLQDFTLTYVINGPPNFDPTYGNSGASASQSTSAGSTWGKVDIGYSVRDTDATSGSATPSAVTPSFEYSLNGGSSWAAITSGYLGASDLTNKTVGESSYNTYSATWDAVGQLGASTYITNAKVRVTVNDNEPVNNTATASSAAFTLDTKTPTLSTFRINGSSATSTVTLISVDDTQIQDYKLSNNSDGTPDGTNASSAILQSVAASSLSLNQPWTLSGATSKTVHMTIRDIYGNTSTTSISGPIVPANTVVKDVSIPSIDSYREFLTWTPFVADTGVVFSKYQIYRSTDATNYSLRTEITDSSLNYFADVTVASSTMYYYKVRFVDTDGDMSDYGSVVNDIPDGQGGTDQIAPTLSSVSVDNIRNTSVRVTWDTDELANSAVDYGVTVSYGSVASSSSFVTSGHALYLTGLTPSTTYYYRPKSTDISENTGTGAAGTFTTVGGPIITGVAVESSSGSSATIIWNTDTSSDSYIDYSVSSNLDSYTSVGSTTLVATGAPYQHRVTLTGLSPATRYYYQVKSMDSGAFTTTDTNAGSYYYFTTTLDQTPPVISNIIVPVIAETSAVIVWTTDELSDSRVELGTIASTTSGSYASTTPLDTTHTITHIISLAGLTGVTDYYYRVKSTDTTGNTSTSDEETFQTASSGTVTITRAGGGGGGSSSTKDTTPPTIDSVTTAATQSFDTKVILAANEPVYALINYGETVSYGQTSGSVELLPNHTVALTSLKPGTTYYYQATVVDKSGNKTESQIGKFKTLFLAESLQNLTLLQSAQDYQSRLQEIIESALPSISPPFIEAPRITEVTEDGAKISYRTNVKSYGIVSYANDADFAKTEKYTTDISVDQEKTLTHETVLKNLKPNTKYHIVTKAFVFPEVVGTSPDIVFTTKASQLAATIVDVTTSSFRAIWKTLVPTTSIVEYTNALTGVTQKKTDSSLTTNHDVVIDNLPLNTAYSVNISGLTSDGNLIDSKQPFSIRTVLDVAAPKITELKIDSALTAGSTKSVQTIVSWKTDEPSTSVVSYEEGSGTPNSVLANKATDTQGLVQNHIVILTNLRQATIYRVQVTSTDAAGNVAALPITTIVTPKQNESIVDVIFKNFGDTFNFIK